MLKKAYVNFGISANKCNITCYMYAKLANGN